jgi:hypothetical protein
MRKGAVLRCSVTGLPLTKKSRNSLCKLPEELLNNDGTFNRSAFQDCNIFDPRTFAAAAGYSDVRYFVSSVLTNPSSPFHAHPIRTENGIVVGYATHTDSAHYGGKKFRNEALAAQTGWPEPPRAMWEIRTASSGSKKKKS